LPEDGRGPQETNTASDDSSFTVELLFSSVLQTVALRRNIGKAEHLAGPRTTPRMSRPSPWPTDADIQKAAQ
jgi:hypothetical protein